MGHKHRNLDQNTFIRIRQDYWKAMVQRYHPEIVVDQPERTPIETNFVHMSYGLEPHIGVFEDEGDTGYLYVVDAENNRIERHLHLYDRAKVENIQPDDVQVVWNKRNSKIGVRVFERLVAVIGLDGQPDKMSPVGRDSPGLSDPHLDGFS